MNFAFQDFRRLVSNLASPIDDRNPVVRYLCAMVAELAYLHIPQFEIDDKRRAQIIPCESYQQIMRKGKKVPSDIVIYLRENDLEGSFAVVDRGVIAVGAVINKLLFIGFRGTSFLFDWKINLRAKLVDVRPNFAAHYHPGRWPGGRLHSGFAEESMRISSKILDAIRDYNIGNIDHIFLSGHSLGGAVAAISEHFLNIAPTSVCIFGTPRYSDLSTYFGLPYGPPTHVARPDDIVPLVPPRSLGYVDHPYEVYTNGSPSFRFENSKPLVFIIWIATLFVCKRAKPHDMSQYRLELGNTAGISSANLPLAPF